MTFPLMGKGILKKSEFTPPQLKNVKTVNFVFFVVFS